MENQQATVQMRLSTAKLELEINQLVQLVNSKDQPEEFGIESVEIPVIDLAITDNYYSAIFEFLFALEIGNQDFVNSAINRIQNSLTVCSELNLLPQWWGIKDNKTFNR